MEPRIQYTATVDGASIAFWATGDGPPYVQMEPAFPFSHLQLEWRVPGWQQWCERLAGQTRLIRYDHRGSGLSDRDVADWSLEALVRDVEAVVDALDLEQFALVSVLHGGPVAIAYAARHPERVSHLMLWCTYARASDVRTPQAEALRALLDKDWEVYTEAMAHVLFGWYEEEARQFASFLRESMTPDEARLAFEAIDQFDVTSLLPQIASATQVTHRRQFPIGSVDVARRLASSIPGARLVLLEGASLAPWIGDVDPAMKAIGDFLGSSQVLAAAPSSGLVTVLFTDIVGHTEMMQRLGDEAGRAVLREHERITREMLLEHGGAEVKTMGDGFMASFASVTKAVECAIALQRAFAQRNEMASEPLQVRVGLNAGEPIAEEGDLFGATVILAARIASQAAAGEILLPEPVRHLLAGKDFLFSDRGETTLRGFEDPLRLWEVRWRGEE